MFNAPLFRPTVPSPMEITVRPTTPPSANSTTFASRGRYVGPSRPLSKLPGERRLRTETSGGAPRGDTRWPGTRRESVVVTSRPMRGSANKKGEEGASPYPSRMRLVRSELFGPALFRLLGLNFGLRLLAPAIARGHLLFSLQRLLSLGIRI